MKITTSLLAFCLASFVYSQSAGYIAVQAGPAGSAEKTDMELFHLNHVLYSRACLVSDLHSSISAKDLAVITTAVQLNLSHGKRTNFLITTPQKVPYQLTVTVFENKENHETGLIILTNFNAAKGKFEKKPKENHYAYWCPMPDEEVVTGGFYTIPPEEEEKFREKKDYISLLYIQLFNTICDSAEMNSLFALSEETQPDMINNRIFLKTYYYLSQYNFNESEKWLEELKRSVATFPIEEQNHWRPKIESLATEIKTLRILKGE